MHSTLLKYNLSEKVLAFSTTRISPFILSDEEFKSMGNYAAFNVTHYCGDSAERVKRNLQWLSGEISEPISHIWLPRQTHSDNILSIGSQFLEKPSSEQQLLLEGVDALITNIPHQCIGVSTADCVPILIMDEFTHVIAAIHAGWRGTVKRIVSKTLQQMQSIYGCNPHNFKALIGPSISVDAFEVGEEVVDAFKEAGFPENVIRRNRNTNVKPHIDLWAANAYLLEQVGIPLENIQIAGVCTYKHSDSFFSARKLGVLSGRIYTAILMD